jgi:hypothetical protein
MGVHEFYDELCKTFTDPNHFVSLGVSEKITHGAAKI